jgi:hypothetical protein
MRVGSLWRIHGTYCRLLGLPDSIHSALWIVRGTAVQPFF